MNYYDNEIKEIFQELESGDNGLDNEKVQEKQLKEGKNKLAEAKHTSAFKKFIIQVINPMNIVLIVTALISSLTTIYDLVKSGEKGSVLDFVDVFIILFVVIINALLGVLQESKAEKSLDALKKMSGSSCQVLRNNQVEIVPEEDLVCGDIVLIEAGSVIPADGRIIESASLQIDEAILTGESVPSSKNEETIAGNEKEIPLGDRHNMAYKGTSVTYGRGKMIVTGIGMNTEMGKIAQVLANDKEEKTPLQKKLDQLSKILTILVIVICLVILVIGVVRSLIDKTISFETILDAFMVSISLAVASIPEGLVSVVTIVLSLGVTMMSKRNAIIRKMTAVETLGCTQVICSDKTGTLTQNKMTVVNSNSEDINLLIKGMCLCTDVSVNEDLKVTGEPTEVSLVEYALKNNFNKNDLEKAEPRINELPFDSMRKMMSTLHKKQDGFVQYTKGGLDCLLPKCNRILTKDGVRAITKEDIDSIYDVNNQYSSKALRVLACAYRDASSSEDIIEEDLIYVGLVGMIDPVRDEVKGAVNRCKDAGIKVVMITGDHIDTAVAIGLELGIISSREQALTGSDIDKLSDEEFDKVIERVFVYARVQPEHKTRIVKTWQKKHKIVAMTGDGVNDAPSIKSADIGIGMGITGTEVTKNVADMVLADDNFNTITVAVEEGRKIYDNIRKSIQFLLSSNLAEVLAIFIATLCGFTLLEPTHLLWINLITDSLPALALGFEKAEKDVMKRKPRSSKEGIFSSGAGIDIVFEGMFIGLITLASYFVGHYLESGNLDIHQISYEGMTMAFLTLSLCEVFQSFNMRSQRKSLFQLKTMNWPLVGAGALAIALMFFVIYTPGVNTLFKFSSITIVELLVSIALASSIFVLMELYKLIWRIIEKRRG